ncbi:unnamed protein product [Blepharisma stoltei]|uniref:Uncharacterized protein n=1 Tax=Blepharisma stoltei TaxID=1481888 RepID=A0AAU9IH15_9CILI|nr:unnamed protein product [Blepharisma stoltei]
MKLSIALFVSCALALSIPDPINDQERNDEIAQSQVRARYLSCLLIYRNLKKELKDFEEIMAATKHDKDLTRKKIFGDLLYRCENTMTPKLAEELLTADEMDLGKEELKDIVLINKEQLLDSGKDIKLTQQQEELIKKITDEANRSDDGFDQEPQVLSDFDINSYMQAKELLHPVLHYFGLAGGISLLLLLAFIMIKKILALSNKDKAKKKSKKASKKTN